MTTWTSRERVLAAFAHEEADRVPAWCGSSEEFWVKAKSQLGLDDEGLRIRFGDDFRRVRARYAGPEFPLKHPHATCLTVFGVEREGLGYGQPIGHPLGKATMVKEIHDYPWPDPDWMDVSRTREEALQWKKQYAVLGGDWSPFWHDVADMVGMENLFIRMYTEPEWAQALYSHVFDYYYAVNERIFAEVGDLVDIFFIGNDLGSNNGALIGTDLFGEYLFPRFKKMADLGHAYGSKVLLHCCGGFRELMPQIIETGIDGVHAIQPSCYGMDMRGLKKDFGDKLLFNGCIDSQFALIQGTPDYVRQETRKTVEIMKPGGGFVAGASHDFILPETPLENVLAMFDTVEEFGKYL